MSAYVNDPRVRAVSGDKYLVNVDGAQWVIRHEFVEVGSSSSGSVWNVYDPEGRLREDLSGRVSADDAIQSVVGDPR